MAESENLPTVNVKEKKYKIYQKCYDTFDNLNLGGYKYRRTSNDEYFSFNNGIFS